jgi:hypothetical protein
VALMKTRTHFAHRIDKLDEAKEEEKGGSGRAA